MLTHDFHSRHVFVCVWQSGDSQLRQLPVSEFPSNLLIHIKNKIAFKIFWKEQNSNSSVGSPSAEEAVEVGCFVARAAVEVKGLD